MKNKKRSNSRTIKLIHHSTTLSVTGREKTMINRMKTETLILVITQILRTQIWDTTQMQHIIPSLKNKIAKILVKTIHSSIKSIKALTMTYTTIMVLTIRFLIKYLKKI